MLYNPVKVNVPSRYHELIKKALEKKGKVSVKINLTAPEKNDTLLLTRGQISKMERAALLGKKTMTIRMSANQVRGNVKEGGFLSLIIAAIASAIAAITAAAPVVVAGVTAALPAIATGAATALGAVGAEELIAAAKGSGLYFRKNGMSVKLEPVEGGGLFLSPYQGDQQQQQKLGDGLQLKHEGKLYGKLEKSPWLREQVPIINVLL